jgi:hypothetical protein
MILVVLSEAQLAGLPAGSHNKWRGLKSSARCFTRTMPP